MPTPKIEHTTSPSVTAPSIIDQIEKVNEGEQLLKDPQLNRIGYLLSLVDHLKQHPEKVKDLQEQLHFFENSSDSFTRFIQSLDTALSDLRQGEDSRSKLQNLLNILLQLEQQLHMVREHAHIETEAQLDIGKEILFVREKIGLTLGGGGLWGFSHIGVLEKLQEKGIPVHLLAGVSFGALVGSILATYIDERGAIQMEGIQLLHHIADKIETLDQITTRDSEGRIVLALKEILGEDVFTQLLGREVRIPVFIQAAEKGGKSGLMLSVPGQEEGKTIYYKDLIDLARASAALKPKFGMAPVTIEQIVIAEHQGTREELEGRTFEDDKTTAIRSTKDGIQHLRSKGASVVLSVPVAFSDTDMAFWRFIKQWVGSTEGSEAIEPKREESGGFGLALTNWALHGKKFADTAKDLERGKKIRVATREFRQAGRNATEKALPGIYDALGLTPLDPKILMVPVVPRSK